MGEREVLAGVNEERRKVKREWGRREVRVVGWRRWKRRRECEKEIEEGRKRKRKEKREMNREGGLEQREGK